MLGLIQWFRVGRNEVCADALNLLGKVCVV